MNEPQNANNAAGSTPRPDEVAADQSAATPTAAVQDYAENTSRRSSLLALAIALVAVIGLVTFALTQNSGANEADVEAAAAAERSAMNNYSNPIDDNDNAPARPKCPVPEDNAASFSADSPLHGVELPCLGAPGQGDVSLSQVLAGKPTVLNVWAWNCAPCRNELPVMENWAAAHPEYNFIGVQASTSAGRGAMLLNDLGVQMPSFQDSNDVIGSALSLPRVVPITVVLREDGTVAKYYAQEFTSEDQLDAAVQEALA